jgi:energy-coupling factor transporter ATP-binding protein EcfA2
MSIVTRLCVSGYRSLRDVRLAVEPLTTVTGTNGSGKSNLYRALRLLADVAQGRIIQSLALEGGISSVLWAGPEQPSRGMKRGDQPVQGRGCDTRFVCFVCFDYFVCFVYSPRLPLNSAACQGQRASGGSDIRIASTLPPVISPNRVPRSCSRLNST